MTNRRTSSLCGPSKLIAATPCGPVSIGEVRSELSQIVAVRSQMVVYDVNQYGKAVRMAVIHEGNELQRRAVGAKRCEQIHSVIAPATSPRKCRQGHQFEMRHAKFNQVRQLSRADV